MSLQCSSFQLYLANYEKTYRFDQVFNEDTPQTSVYAVVAKPVLRSFIAGSNAAILAYGQTGTGKTYTMGTNTTTCEFDDDGVGLIPRVVRDVFKKLESTPDKGVFSTLKISFFEILNEKIYDLLKAMKVPLALKEVGGEFFIPDLKCASVVSENEAISLLEHGCRTRSTGATAQNANSSRSHAVFRIALARTNPDTGETTESKISLVDLAGSESSAASGGCGHDRRQEGVNINKGLSVLNRCIGAICDKEKYIPFRDSVLTKVLRNCLTGDGMTAMIACVSPTADDVKETVNTLRYADCVKRLEKPTMPAHLTKVATSYKKLQMLPPTPASTRKRGMMNNTIETPTPTKRRAMMAMSNSTKKMNKSASAILTSSVPRFPLETIRDVSDDVELCDSISDISGIHSINNSIVGPGSTCGSSVSRSALNMSIVDARSVLSPLMRNLKDDLKKHIEDTIKGQLEASILMSVKKEEERGRRRSSRATSSPVRQSLRLEAANEEDGDETIISGTQFAHKMREAGMNAMRSALSDVTNRKVNHLRCVEETASPKLPKRKSNEKEEEEEEQENPQTPKSSKKKTTYPEVRPYAIFFFMPHLYFLIF